MPNSGDGLPRVSTGVQTAMFGMDFGNSLAKVVYFEAYPLNSVEDSATKCRSRALSDYIKSKTTYPNGGVREDHLVLEITLNGLKGCLHFLRFPAVEITNVLDAIKSHKVTTRDIMVSATGQGAYIYQHAIMGSTEVDYKTFDEFTTMANGLQYFLKHSPQECYRFVHEQNNELCQKVPVHNEDIQYPYLCVTIGSATSIQLITGPGNFTVIGGSNIGGGTFLGLASLLTSATTFDEAMDLAKKGNNKDTVDKLLGPAGCDYYLNRFGTVLDADMEAVHFGHMLDAEKRKSAKPEDIVRGLLCMVTSVVTTAVVGSLGVTGGLTGAGVKHVLFLGSFLRDNELAMRRLTNGLNISSKGAITPVFLKHEGFCGALGTIVERLQNNS